MGEEFEFRDLSESEFWGVDLKRTYFRDVDMTGVRVEQARLVDVSIDAEIERLVVNGVDVTDYVNEHDPWFPLRSTLNSADAEAMRAGWPRHLEAWRAAIDRARGLSDEQRHASVDGEWSFVQTMRHLVFATDKWMTGPVLGGTFHPIGLPNSGSATFGWPNLDPAAAPTFDDAVAAWEGRAAAVSAHLEDLEDDALRVEVEVLENGASSVRQCVGVVFEEHFHHLRYALRDLDRL